MKKLLAFVLSLAMMIGVMPTAFASNHSPFPPSDPDYGIMPLDNLYYKENASATVEWIGKFSANPGDGNYIRVWHQNNTNEEVKFYLYRTDSGKDVQVKYFKVPANSSESAVYLGTNADSGHYKIVIEAYVSGGDIDGPVAAAQYRTNPNL